MSNILNRFEELEEVNTNIDKYLTFLIENQYYAYPIKDVREIIEIQEITKVSEFPPYAKGIINLRGVVIPVIDVRLRFRKQEIAYTERTCIIVLRINDLDVGFIVDTVDEVIDINKSDISTMPSLNAGEQTKYIDGVGKINQKIIMILNANRMMTEKDIKMIQNNI